MEGNTIGEEISHFFRNILKPIGEKRELLTNEFFGYLGRRILYWISPNAEVRKECFPRGIELQYDRSETLKISNQFKVAKLEMKSEIKRIREIKDVLIRDQETAKLAASERYRTFKILKNNRNVAVSHFRGYDFASRVDISKIHDWKKLFSMPDKEVRRRFFTPTPDYSGL